MNRKPEIEELLNDVFAEGAPADFREASLGDTLRRIRRRRYFRKGLQGAAVAMIFGILSFLVWPGREQQPMRAPVTAKIEKGYKIIHTHPMPAGSIVTTHATTFENLKLPKQSVAIVGTKHGEYRVINDEELLALLGPRPAALIRVGADSEELVFINPETQEAVPVN